MNKKQEAFVKWAVKEDYDLTKNLYPTLSYNEYEDAYTDSKWEGWQAAQVDQAATIAQLQEDNAKLRDALDFIANRSNTMYECEVCASEALSTTSISH